MLTFAAVTDVLEFVAGVFGLAIVVLLVVALIRGPMHFGEKAMMRLFEGISLRDNPQSGDVSVRYQTYRGLLFLIETDHQFFAVPEDARRLLGRMLRFNLTWGVMTYGAIFVPFFALGNYCAQLRSIRRQEQQGSPR